MTAPDWLHDRFRGALVGTALGDALGAPFEGRPKVDGGDVRAWQDAAEPLRWTDDTAMTIGVAESLTARGGFDGADMAARFVAHFDAEPWRGYGSGPPQVFAEIRAGAPWDEPATRLHQGRGSFGNGAAMRAAPFGLLAYRDPAEAARMASAAAGITHTHDLARQGAAMQAFATAWLASADPGQVDTAAGQLVDGLRSVAPDPALQQRLDALASLPSQAPVATVVEVLGNGIAALDAVPTAVHAALRNRHSFRDTVGYAVSLGGDTDTIAAMAGALTGALHGCSAVPPAWLHRLEARERLVDLADDLHSAAPPLA